MSRRAVSMLVFSAVIFIVSFSVIFTGVFAMNITRSMPSLIESGSLFNTNITINVDAINMSNSYVESIPPDFIFNSWQINGTKESVNDILVKVSGTGYTWNFTPTESKVKIVYYLLAPDTEGDYTFSGRASDSTNTASDTYSVTVGKTGCGNGLCEANENSTSCPADCAASSSSGVSSTQPNVVQTVTTTTTTTISSSNTANDDIFAQKRSSGSNNTKLYIILLSTALVLGLTGYGMYMQIQRKKGKTSGSTASPNQFGGNSGKGFFSFFSKNSGNNKDIFAGVKDAIDKFTTKTDSETENGKQMTKKEHIEIVSSELPSFTEAQSKFEIPSMPSEVRRDQNVVLSIPPIPKRTSMQGRTPISPGMGIRVPLRKQQISGLNSSTSRKNINSKSQAVMQKPVSQKPKQESNSDQPQKAVSEDDVDNALDSIMKEKKQKND